MACFLLPHEIDVDYSLFYWDICNKFSNFAVFVMVRFLY